MDIGNLHVIDYYLHRALTAMRFAGVTTRMQRARFCIVTDEFDLETEQREGWSI